MYPQPAQEHIASSSNNNDLHSRVAFAFRQTHGGNVDQQRRHLAQQETKFSDFYVAQEVAYPIDVKTFLRTNNCNLQTKGRGKGKQQQQHNATDVTCIQAGVANPGITPTLTATTLNDGTLPKNTAELTRTHLLLNGGISAVSDHLMPGFLAAYSYDVRRSKDVSISEQRSDVFRMHWDFDIKTNVDLTPDQLLEFVKVVQQDCRNFFPESTEEMIMELCLAIVLVRAKVADKAHEGVFSFGVHVVMPNLWVDQDQALRMRGSNVAVLKTTFAGRYPSFDWEKIVDHQIYTTNGLRMPFSTKFSKCPHCEADKKRTPTCVNVECRNGKVNVGRIYLPHCALLGNGSLDESLSSRIRDSVSICLQYSIIRCPSDCLPTSGWKLYVGCPAVDVAKLMPPVRKLRKNSATNNTDGRPAEPVLPYERVAVTEGTLEYDTIVNLLEKAYARDPRYSRIQFASAYHNMKRTYYVVDVSGIGSSFCQNIQRDHESRKIYFYITLKGISQKCRCRCKTLEGRRSGKYCGEYESPPIKLTAPQKGALFTVVDTMSASVVPKTTPQSAVMGPSSQASKLQQLASLNQMLGLKISAIDRERSDADSSRPSARKRVKI